MPVLFACLSLSEGVALPEKRKRRPKMNPSNYADDSLVQQITAGRLKHQFDWELVYAYNNEDFGLGRILGDSAARRLYE